MGIIAFQVERGMVQNYHTMLLLHHRVNEFARTLVYLSRKGVRVMSQGYQSALPPAASMSPRQQRIVAMLENKGFVSVRDLAAFLNVSEMTVRRDLRMLAKNDSVRLVHGGAALTHGTLRTPDFVNRAGVEGVAKHAIAERARQYVKDGDTVAIDAALQRGAEKARALAEPTLRRVYDSLGLLR